MTFHTVIAHILALLKTFSVKHRLSAGRDWLILISITLIALLASLAWNVWFFWSTVDTQTTESSARLQNTDELNAVEQAAILFHGRAAEALRYQSDVFFVDPSR